METRQEKVPVGISKRITKYLFLNFLKKPPKHIYIYIYVILAAWSTESCIIRISEGLYSNPYFYFMKDGVFTITVNVTSKNSDMCHKVR